MLPCDRKVISCQVSYFKKVSRESFLETRLFIDTVLFKRVQKVSFAYLITPNSFPTSVKAAIA